MSLGGPLKSTVYHL